MTQPARRRSRGGQRGHEPVARIRTRQLRAMELRVLGWSQPRIAADLGITQAAVCKLLKRVETRALRELAETLGRQKAQQAFRLEHLFAEAIRAWHASQADSTRRRQRQTHGADGPGATVAELIVENQHGDPRYLDEARKALADARKLMGLDAPQKLDLRAALESYEGMSEEALREALERNARLLDLALPTLDITPSKDPTATDATAAPAPLPKKDSPDGVDD